MATDDEDRPRKKITHEIGQELALLSVGELNERIALLQGRDRAIAGGGPIEAGEPQRRRQVLQGVIAPWPALQRPRHGKRNRCLGCAKFAKKA